MTLQEVVVVIVVGATGGLIGSLIAYLAVIVGSKRDWRLEVVMRK